jgi:drug/metabolite transporter (DMT)-like permease
LAAIDSIASLVVVALGIAAAIAASLLYNTSIALQALEAREVPGEHSLRPSLIGRLVRNRRWLGATALGLAGWPLEIGALLLAPLTVVQPCLASGLILLLWLGAKKLGEAPGRREWTAVAAIVVGVAGVAWAAPDRTTDHAGAGAIALALALVAIPIAAPYALRGRAAALGWLPVVSAGFGYAWTAIASKLLTDELATGALLVAVAWLATAAASEGLALLSEMSALQSRPATHVAPVMFAVQVLVPVLLAPLIFGESWSTTPLGGVALVGFMAIAIAGTTLLAGSRAVGAVIDSAHEDRHGAADGPKTSI